MAGLFQCEGKLTEANRIAAETLHLEQVGEGEEPSLEAAPTLSQKDSQAWQQESISSPFYDTAGLGWFLHP